MQNWTRIKIKQDVNKFVWKDWLAKYQGIVMTATLAFIIMIGMYFLYKANVYTVETHKAMTQMLADVIQSGCSAQIIQG